MSGHDFDEFLRRREAAARAYVSGDPAPLGEIVARVSPATFFGPRGGYLQGTRQVWASYERDAAAFGPNSENRLEIVDQGASGDLAYWVGFQRTTAQVSGKPTEFNLRVTEVFRREDGEWKLVHRHADPLATPSGQDA